MSTRPTRILASRKLLRLWLAEAFRSHGYNEIVDRSLLAEGYNTALFDCNANQPESDLIVAKGEKLMKVSVKGSQDGSWGLAQSDLAKLGQANIMGRLTSG